MTLAEWQSELELWMAARAKILEGNQSYTSPDGSSYTRADLTEINKQITHCRRQIEILSGAAYGGKSFVFGGRS